jgi:hypothetical protein
MSATAPSSTGGAQSGAAGAHNKTAKRISSDNFTKVVEETSNDAYKRPWHRLERGLRLNRLRIFMEEEKKKLKLTQFEGASLLALLQKALEKRLLNSKTTVVYDGDAERILEIKGLVMHRGADGVMQFQILEKKPAGTVRKRREDGAATGGGAGQAEQN